MVVYYLVNEDNKIEFAAMSLESAQKYVNTVNSKATIHKEIE